MAVEYDGRDRPRVSLAELREQLELEIAKGRVEGQASASIFGRLCAASDEVVSGELGVSPRTDPVGYALAQIEVLQVRAAAIQKLGAQSEDPLIQEYAALLGPMYVHMREALAAGVEPAAVMTDEVTMRAALRLQELDSLIEPRV